MGAFSETWSWLEALWLNVYMTRYIYIYIYIYQNGFFLDQRDNIRHLQFLPDAITGQFYTAIIGYDVFICPNAARWWQMTQPFSKYYVIIQKIVNAGAEANITSEPQLSRNITPRPVLNDLLTCNHDGNSIKAVVSVSRNNPIFQAEE